MCRLGQRAGGGHLPTHGGDGPGRVCRQQRGSHTDDRYRGRRRQANPRGFPALRQDGQRDGRAARCLRLRGDACGARGRCRGEAGRSGQGQRRFGHMERAYRQRELDGRQPHQPGAGHCRGDDRRGPWRPDQEGRGRGQGRDPEAQEHGQHHGRPARLVRLGGDSGVARCGYGGCSGRAGGRQGRLRNLAGADRQRQLNGRQPDRPGAQHRRGHNRHRQRRPQQEDHGGCQGRDPRSQEHRQLDGREAERLRRRGHPNSARRRHRRCSRRSGGRARGFGPVAGSDRQRQLHGRQPDQPGAQYRRGHNRRGPGRSLAQDHGRCQGRDPGTQEHHQHHGGQAAELLIGGHPGLAPGRHRGDARRAGRGKGCLRRLEGSDRQRQPDGRQPDRPGAGHRPGDDRGGRGRTYQENHGGGQRRDPGAEEHHQHHGRPALQLRRRGHPGGSRGGNRRHTGRSGRGGRGLGHVEGADKERQSHGHQPDQPGAQHRRGDDRGGQGRPLTEDHRRGQRRDTRASKHDQHDGGPAFEFCRRGHAGSARSGNRGPAWRPGRGDGCLGHLEGAHPERQPDGRQPDRPGAQHRGSDDRRCQGQPLPENHGGGQGRDPGTQEHHQHHGGPALQLRRRGHPGCARGGHQRPARRPGRGAGRIGHMEGADRQREPHGQQPDRPGAKYRRGHHGRRQRRPDQEDHR